MRNPWFVLIWWIAALGAAMTILSGCNMWGGFDLPDDPDDRYLAAVAKADGGDCEGARDLLLPITSRNDDQNLALGWAQLCVAGATTKNIATSLYKYTSSSSDLTLIGNLARSMQPMTGGKLGSIDEATENFSKLSNPRVQSVEVAITKLVKAAGLLAYQATVVSDPILRRRDIASAACDAVASNCAAGCAVTTDGIMSDAHVTAFTNAISQAAAALASSGAQDLSSLATAINAKVSGATNVARCYIYKEMVPAD